ncbi:MAG: DUF1330 domain-containing protein [Candidatus Omnitrophica bacterium]|nr:DUF1330 domain-containing protein [Candidatus Omnitrophota bacterium]MBD3268833.1 DUF1330 domain-containing protein [Candidatus Omnitrophota bacterium]
MKKVLALTFIFIVASQIFLFFIYHRGGDKGIYMVAEIEILDEELYRRYTEKVYPLVVKYGGRYLVRGGEAYTISGGWQPERIIIIEFSSMEALKECFGSSEYKAIASLREESTRSKAIAVEGIGNGL